ncbi:MAG TPA: hypothetical protein G4O06_02550 [Dehalococcoidia bacterium]|nr:hypothetical protein [Dehalococcoidia bacterium]
MDDTCWEVYGGYLKQRRDAGASLKKIGDEVGCTKQRIHKILVKHYGTADSEGTLSTSQLLKQLTCSSETLHNLRKEKVISWVSWGKWKPETIDIILELRKCKICGQQVGKNRRTYCSEACAVEGKKFKYWPEWRRKAQCERTRHWRG